MECSSSKGTSDEVLLQFDLQYYSLLPHYYIFCVCVHDSLNERWMQSEYQTLNCGRTFQSLEATSTKSRTPDFFPFLGTCTSWYIQLVPELYLDNWLKIITSWNTKIPDDQHKFIIEEEQPGVDSCKLKLVTRWARDCSMRRKKKDSCYLQKAQFDVQVVICLIMQSKLFLSLKTAELLCGCACACSNESCDKDGFALTELLCGCLRLPTDLR